MGLPFVLDVAIGLVFIYLTLSLLASEIQELIATLLQWRARHLRDAIEVFLAGGVNSRSAEVQQLVVKLYDDPLLKNINQEAKGLLTGLARQFSRLFPGNHKGAFGRNRSTGPSYIAPETFATSLLEQLGLATLAQKLTEVRLEEFKDRILNQIEAYGKSNVPDFLNEASEHGRNFKNLRDEYQEVLDDFKREKLILITAIERLGENFSAYITSYPIPQNESPSSADQQLIYFAKRLRSFKLSVFGEKNERALRSGGLRPSLIEIAELVNRSSRPYKAVEAAYQTIKSKGKEIEKRINPELEKKLLEEYPDVIEQQLMQRDVELAGEQPQTSGALGTIEQQLKKDYPDIFRHIESSLRRSNQKLFKAKANHPYRRKRRGMKATESWVGKHWQEFIRNDLTGLQGQRRRLIDRVFNQLDDREQRVFISKILETLSSQERAEMMDGALVVLDSEDRHLLVDQVWALIAQDTNQNNENLPPLTEEHRVVYNHYQTYKLIQQILDQLPSSVQESFAILARRAQTRVQQTENDINQFRQEVELWFDRSMSRSSGVYKRNAKGAALLIGLMLAIGTNSDTFYMIDRLSSDQNLRRVVTEQAIQIRPIPVASPNTDDTLSERQQLENIKTITDAALREISLPIGWNPINLSQQLGCQAIPDEPDSKQWKTLVNCCLPEVGRAHWNSLPRILLGWLVSGIAISMGAPFWFDLLGKIVNVRNSGGKPPSPAAELPKPNNPE